MQRLLAASLVLLCLCATPVLSAGDRYKSMPTLMRMWTQPLVEPSKRIHSGTSPSPSARFHNLKAHARKVLKTRDPKADAETDVKRGVEKFLARRWPIRSRFGMPGVACSSGVNLPEISQVVIQTSRRALSFDFIDLFDQYAVAYNQHLLKHSKRLGEHCRKRDESWWDSLWN